MSKLISDAQLAEIQTRSSNGEGVSAILKTMNINSIDGLTYLRDNHIGEIVAAKKAQIAKKAADKADKEKNA